MDVDPHILDKRLLVVTGKGGVGKSTVSAALALAALRRGKRVLVCEVGARERIHALLGHAQPAGTEGRELEQGLHVVHVQPREAMREYALMKLRFQTIYNAVFENRLVRAFLRLIPSLAETVVLGKVWYEVEREENGRPVWDLVILDAPATGHGLSLLRLPQVLLDTVPGGPMREDARKMQATLSDPARTSLQIVSIPEEMAVSETQDLYDQVHDALELPLGYLFLNAFVDGRFSDPEVERLEVLTPGEVAPQEGMAPEAAAAAAALHQVSRARMSDYYRRKLEVEITEMPLVPLPRLYASRWGRDEIERLSQVLSEVVPEVGS